LQFCEVMKTQDCLSALVICSVSLTIGCARVNDAPKKPTVKPDPVTTPEVAESPKAGDLPTIKITSAGSLAIAVAGSMSSQNAADGLVDPPASVGEPAPLQPIPEMTSTGEIASADIVGFIERIRLPLVLPFAMPKHDVKEEVPRFVGIGCDREVAKAKSVKVAGNLVSMLADDLCYTNILRQGSPKVVVVPGKLITRHTKIGGGRIPTVERTYEVVLRKDSSVSAIRETIVRGKGETEVRVATVNDRGAVMTSEVTSKSSKMVFDWGRGAVRYEAVSLIGNGKVTSAKKTLVARGYKGMNLTVIEESPTTNPADITCNVIAINKSTLDVSLSETVQGRCFHRQ
jgi:hypothetical protein